MNNSQILPVWNFRKLRNRCWNKRTKELVSYHEAGHAILIEYLTKNTCHGEIIPIDSKWSGFCELEDENLSDLNKSTIGFGGILGELGYIMMCQKSELKNDSKSLVNDVLNYFEKNKLQNYQTDISFVMSHKNLGASYLQGLDIIKNNTEKLINIAELFFRNHKYNTGDLL